MTSLSSESGLGSSKFCLELMRKVRSPEGESWTIRCNGNIRSCIGQPQPFTAMVTDIQVPKLWRSWLQSGHILSQTEGFAGVWGLLCLNRASPGQTMMRWATLLTWRPQTLQLLWASQTCAHSSEGCTVAWFSSESLGWGVVTANTNSQGTVWPRPAPLKSQSAVAMNLDTTWEPSCEVRWCLPHDSLNS